MTVTRNGHRYEVVHQTEAELRAVSVPFTLYRCTDCGSEARVYGTYPEDTIT